MPKRLRFHPDAESEIREAQEWYARQSEQAARRFVTAVEHAIGQVRRRPAQGPRYLFHTRRWMLGRFPYLIVYRESESAIFVFAVSHLRRKPGYWSYRLADEE